MSDETEKLEIARARETADRERARRADQSSEADRRALVRATLARPDIYELLEPPTPDMEQDENAVTERLMPGMTLETAFAAEVLLLAGRGMVQASLSASATARRLFEAYDEESAGRVRNLPESLLTAERVYAHLGSLPGCDKLPGPALTTLARRATILLYNRKWLVPDGPVPSPVPVPSQAPGPDDEDLLCVDCGRDLAPGAQCPCSAKTVSVPSVRGTAPPENKQERPAREKPYADYTLVVDPHGLGREEALRRAAAEQEPEYQRKHEPRVVTGYARVTADMTFATKDPSTPTGRGPDVTLRAGAVVEVMEPSPMDSSDIKKKAEEGIQLVTVRWSGKVRLVRGAVLVPATRSEWERDHEGR